MKKFILIPLLGIALHTQGMNVKKRNLLIEELNEFNQSTKRKSHNRIDYSREEKAFSYIDEGTKVYSAHNGSQWPLVDEHNDYGKGQIKKKHISIRKDRRTLKQSMRAISCPEKFLDNNILSWSNQTLKAQSTSSLQPSSNIFDYQK